MVRTSRPAVVANLTESAIPPGADPSAPTPATPTTLTEATGQGGNRRISGSRSISHRGYIMIVDREDDGEGFTTPEYLAWKPGIEPLNLRGEILHLNHQRFGFTPTQEWFAGEVDRALAKREGLGAVVADGLGVLLCFALFGVVACGAAVLA